MVPGVPEVPHCRSRQSGGTKSGYSHLPLFCRREGVRLSLGVALVLDLRPVRRLVHRVPEVPGAFPAVACLSLHSITHPCAPPPHPPIATCFAVPIRPASTCFPHLHLCFCLFLGDILVACTPVAPFVFTYILAEGITCTSI